MRDYIGNMDLYAIANTLRGQGSHYKCSTFYRQAAAIYDSLGFYSTAAQCIACAEYCDQAYQESELCQAPKLS
jgi:hypothetical protein